MVTMDRWTGQDAKLLRQALRLTIHNFAEDLGVSPRTISKWEAAGVERIPRPELQAALDTLLARTTAEQSARFERLHAIAAHIDQPQGQKDTDRPAGKEDLIVDRTQGFALRQGLRYAPDWRRATNIAISIWERDATRNLSASDAEFDATAFLPPAMRWLTTPVAPLGNRPTGAGERLIGKPDVETIRQITAVYRGLDNRYGGGHIRSSLVRFLANDVAVLLRGRYDAHTGATLLSAVAEATQLAAWATYDIGMNGLAQEYMVQALRFAAAADDRALGAEILAAMSHQASHNRASAEAIDLARASGKVALEVGAVAIGAESAVLEAQGHAVIGDEASCGRALNRAERDLDRADRTSDPQWIEYLDQSYLAAKFGHCFAALGRGDIAQKFAVRSLNMDGTRYARGRQFNLALLAAAYAQSGEVELATEFGIQAVEAAKGLRSHRARKYLIDISDHLTPHAEVASVKAFRDRVRRLERPNMTKEFQLPSQLKLPTTP